MSAVSVPTLKTSKYPHTIDGEPESSDQFFEVINPSTGAPFALAPDASRSQLDRAVIAAQHAYPSWRSLSFDKRREKLESFAELIRKHADDIANILTCEQGKPLSDAKSELSHTAWEIKTLCQFEPSMELIPVNEND